MSIGGNTRMYRNKLFFVEKNLLDVSQEVYRMGRKALMGVYESTRGNNHIKNISSLVKVMYFTYLTASRIGEVLKDPKPKLSMLTLNNQAIMRIEKINEKHKRTDGSPAIIPQNLPIFSLEEKLMWDYLTAGGKLFDLGFLDEWRPYTTGNRTRITNLFSSNFKTILTDGEKIYEEEGIIPHMLRHLRVYSLLYNAGLPKDLVQAYLGWKSAAMFAEYIYIEKQMKNLQQLAILKPYLEKKEKAGEEYKLGVKYDYL